MKDTPIIPAKTAIKSLRDSFEKMNSFNFENLEILKNV